MKILIAASAAGTASYEEMLAKKMYEYLKARGNTADYFLLPYKNNILNLPEQVLAYRLLDVSSADILITIGYPACFLNHPNKYIYLLETAPSIHEYWDSEYGTLGNYQYSQILISINELEAREFANAKKVFCGSKLLCQDLAKRDNIEAELLYIPELFTENQKENKLKHEKEEYYICETYLPQYSRVFEFCTQLKNEKKFKTFYYIPDADPVYFQALESQMKRCGLKEHVKLFLRHPEHTELLGSKAGLFFDYMARRPNELLMRYISQNIPIVVAEDSGYSAEIAHQYGKSMIVPFDRFCERINSGYVEESNKCFRIQPFEFFVKGILKNENCTF